MNEQLVEEWIIKADEDYYAAEYLYEKSKEKFSSIICFHAQQCAEKYLKAIFTKYNIEPIKLIL
jgi:HEPN domain-containing protein